MVYKDSIIRDLQDDLFERRGSGWFRIVSGSMYPLIAINDIVLVKKVSPSEVRPNDVVLFRCDDILVTHRVIGIVKHQGRKLFLQKGDGGGSAGFIAPESVLGRVVVVNKREKILDLCSGKGRVLSNVIGVINRLSYKVDSKLRGIKEWVRNKPGLNYSRVPYRFSLKVLRLLKREIVRIFLSCHKY